MAVEIELKTLLKRKMEYNHLKDQFTSVQNAHETPRFLNTRKKVICIQHEDWNWHSKSHKCWKHTTQKITFKKMLLFD